MVNHFSDSSLVYVVETPDMADFCREVLRQYCRRVCVETFTSPDEAVSALSSASARPQVVCASLVGMQGLRLAENVKLIDPSVRVLLMSGLGSERILEKLSNASVLPDIVLPKPFTPEDFSSKIQSLIE